MCLLTYIPGGTQPHTERLADGADVNEDGHGFAIVVGDRIVTGHGLNPGRVIDQFADVRKHHPEGPALFHSRMSTGGTINKSNCHPFRVGGDPRTVLAHNGIMPKVAWPGKKDPRSDTRIVAEDLIPQGKFGQLTNHRGRRRFARWMGDYNKVVLLTVNPRFQKRSYILNEDSGQWVDGIWYSNDGYLGWSKYVKKWTAKGYTWQDCTERYASDRDCPNCWSNDTVDPITRVCKFCGCCADCCDLEEDCQCWLPASLDRLPKHILTP